MNVRLTMGYMFLALTIGAAGCSVPAALNGVPIAHNMPPAEQIMHPGPGVGGPGPGVIAPIMPVGFPYAPKPSVQVKFNKPEAMQIRWDVTGVGQFDSAPLIVPGRKNFPEGGLYRLKVTNIPGREGIVFYPSLELAYTTPRTAAFLAHAPIPIQFTEEDFDQTLADNFVTKVIYIPDPEFQELALAGVDTLVSTRLDPGVDPIIEADRRGAILAIVRMGNKDMEMEAPLAPSMTAPVGYTTDGGFASAPYNLSPSGQPGPPVGAPPIAYSSGGVRPNYVSGITTPPYGMPITGTPIGLPGPPHIPLGIPAGLQKHVIQNHTAMHIPGPTKDLKVNVKQAPGMSYPRPADRVHIKEETIRPPHFNTQPPANMVYGDPPIGHAHH